MNYVVTYIFLHLDDSHQFFLIRANVICLRKTQDTLTITIRGFGKQRNLHQYTVLLNISVLTIGFFILLSAVVDIFSYCTKLK
jgi:hypothetical protein